MSRSFALRLADTFFRRWWLCLLPVVLLTALGVATASATDPSYQAETIVYVESETLLAKLTGAGANTNNGFLSPAQAANERLGSLLGTDGFVGSVADRANLTELVATNALSLDDVRSSIGIEPSSPNTLRVVASNEDPAISFNLASATVDTFIQWVIDASLSDSTTAEKFLRDLAETYRAELDLTTKALAAYLQQRPEPAVGSRPAAESVEISRLTGAVDAARDKLTDAESKAEAARLEGAQTRSDVSGRLRVVDAPKLPTEPTSARTDQILQVAVYAILGMMLSALAVVLGTLTDRTVRIPAQVPDLFGLPLLAVVPESRQARGNVTNRLSHG